MCATCLSSLVSPSTVESTAIGWLSLITSQLGFLNYHDTALTVILSMLYWSQVSLTKVVGGDFGGSGHATLPFYLLW